jgi:hypothetical protein
MAARATIAIRIGIRGEEEESLEDVWEPVTRDACSEAVAPCLPAPWGPAVEPLPGLPWPVPPPLPVLGLVFADDGLPEDPSPEAPEFPEPVAVEPPPFDEAWAGVPPPELVGGVGVVCPVTVGTAVSYWTPLESA